MLISVFILSVITGILMFSLVEVQSLFQTTSIMAALQAEARFLTARLASDLRMTALSQTQIQDSTQVPGSHELKFKRPNFSSNNPVINNYVVDWNPSEVEIRFDPSDKTTLIKHQQGDKIILSKNVKKINFANYDSSGHSLYMHEMHMSLTLEKTDTKGRTHSFNTTTVIDMRN